MNNKNKNAKIILIGGCSGTGKSTISKELSERLNLIHRIGTGFVREIVRQFINNDKQYMFGYTFQADSQEELINRFVRQSKELVGAVKACIERARAEGTSLVIEGAHIIPGLFNDCEVSLSIVLRNRDSEKHHDMILGPTHFNRKITNEEFSQNLILQDYICGEAKKHQVPIIDVERKDLMLDKICSLMDEKNDN